MGNTPFGEQEVFEGMGQLRPHGVKLPGGGVLACDRQPDGQHLEQGRDGQLPGALRRAGVLQTQRDPQGLGAVRMRRGRESERERTMFHIFESIKGQHSPQLRVS